MAGRTQLGLNGISQFYFHCPFINLWKQSGLGLGAVDNLGDSWVFCPPGEVDPEYGLPSGVGTYLDTNGELKNPLPATFAYASNTIWLEPQNVPADQPRRTGESWILKWDGTATDVRLQDALPSIYSQTGNRMTFTWPGPGDFRFRIAGVDLDDPPRNWVCCRADHEALHDAGQIFNPDWLEHLQTSTPFGILRFMDWMTLNNNRGVRNFADFPSMDDPYWSIATGNPRMKLGIPLELIPALCNEVGSDAWVNIPQNFGTAKLNKITGVTRGATTVIDSFDHGFEVGDSLIPYLVNGTSQLNRTMNTVSAVTDNTITINTNSSGFGAYTDGGYMMSPFDLSRMTTQTTLFANYFKNNIAAPRVVYFEPGGNEWWNAIFDAFHMFSAQWQAAGETDQTKLGYLCAHWMNAIRLAYNDRTRWRGVLPSQAANASQTTNIVDGVNDYCTEHSLEITDLFDHLAIAPYYTGVWANANKATITTWMDDSETAFENGEELARWNYLGHMVNKEYRGDGVLTIEYPLSTLRTDWLEHKAIVEPLGLTLIMYEGGQHEVFGGDFATDPDVARYRSAFQAAPYTAGAAATWNKFVKMWRDDGGVFPSKFVDMANPSSTFTWGGLRSVEDSNPFWDAVVDDNEGLRVRAPFKLAT